MQLPCFSLLRDRITNECHPTYSNLLVCSTGVWTQVFVHARQIINHWATAPPLGLVEGTANFLSTRHFFASPSMNEGSFCLHCGQHLVSSDFCCSEVCSSNIFLFSWFCGICRWLFPSGLISWAQWSWMILILSGVLAVIASGLPNFHVVSPDIFTWWWKVCNSKKGDVLIHSSPQATIHPCLLHEENKS